MSSQPPAADLFGRHRDSAEKLLYLAVAAKIAIIFLFAWQILIVMDEFGQLGFAKHLGTRIFETVQPTKALGFAVFYKLAHLVGWDAVSIVLAARMQTALLACGTLYLVYACARALGEDRLRALAIVLVLLCFSNFMERIFRTISEPPALFFGLAALLVVVRGQADRPRTVVMAGVLSGVAFLITQKAVYFNVALGLALLADAAIAGRYLGAIRRGAWLVLGWVLPIVAYCFAFRGVGPIEVAQSIVYGPLDVATRGGREYGGLRVFVLQFFSRNLGLSALCLAGMVMSLRRIRQLPENRRVALVFSGVITVLVLAHDQPWPYVFILALPFMALWALVPLDSLAQHGRWLRVTWIGLIALMATSYVSNFRYFRFDNDSQLLLVARAEAMLDADERYFDAIAILPNRQEPTTLWLDRYFVLKTLREGTRSEAYQVLTQTPPKLVIWSYRMDAVEPVVGPEIRDSYVRVAPNIWLAGQRLKLGQPQTFDVPLAGRYRLYDAAGHAVSGQVNLDGTIRDSHVELARGPQRLALQSGPGEVLLLPEGQYVGSFAPGGDDPTLFAGVYQ